MDLEPSTLGGMICLTHTHIWRFPIHGDTEVSQIILSLNHFSIETHGDDWGSPFSEASGAVHT